MGNTISRRDFLKATAAGTLSVAMLGATGLVAGAAENADKPASKSGLAPVFNGYGSKYEYGHFTVEANVINANSEDFNPNPSFSVYHIMDYTAEVPYADSMATNGATNDNNTASMYVITSGNDALLIDMGNGSKSTASHFGEDPADEAVLAKIDEEYRDLVLSLVDGRNFKIAITHKHGDHVGFSTALAGLGYTVLFPEGDLNDSIKERFAEYDLQTFVPGEFQIPVGDITIDTILCGGHTDASTIFVISTPVITYNYDASNASATYITFIGDAIGSGSSVWIFTLPGLQMLNDQIDDAVKKLESYTAFDAGLGAGEQKGAKLLLLGGHGWQYQNRFGTMDMDLEYAKSMQNLIHVLSDGSKWQYDGVDGLSLEDWMKRGHVTLKAVGVADRYTAYFGTTLTSAAGITCPIDALRQYAGLIPVEE
ncbi:MAG: twin-arginine translocation signal domain-containing protein [Lachnospiraceae bacterium]|nr:twin-arginine translocation signal domain-containing protein [Lachnospiraceae bacterium]